MSKPTTNGLIAKSIDDLALPGGRNERQFARYKSSQLLRLSAGKVHGSLARAGKVKSQTPKVDKQEKPKQPRGRAYKRKLYTRRFVNVATTPGGKRKMNPGPSSKA
ncbi:unnamed protein product [Kuraishia capsulata CBS 1993]|uniref:Uncharacterized protein n=1 Tax=Kuraishia capsulata CBS 1993 TaxID=1382522 RepID=W6MJD7_9ASCO|nr:uncharacterized protein KUCA_T00002353001 [Kuraishia capsulata CBS 1993]CDK26381.1 unnamed protein product [Kuraishia capsulata CBS 1993]